MTDTKTESVVCRLADEKDTAQVQALWETCFDDTAAFVQWYFSRYYKSENTLGIFAGADLQASAQMIPYTIQLRDTALPCAYIVGVDTAPAARKKGYARTLLRECLAEQRKRKQPISLLMPFEGQFYYRYGWPFCYFHQQMVLQPQELCCAAREWGNIRQIDLHDAQPQLAAVYAQFVRHYHGAVLRSEQQWQWLLEDAALDYTQCFLLEEDGQVQGYCLWTPLKGRIFIREMAWCNEQARAGLLWFLQEAVPEGQQLWLELPEDDALAGQLAVTKKAVVRYPFLMARIVDVAQCLEAIHYPAQNAQLVLAVTDNFADWNNGVYQLTITDGNGTVQQLTKDAAFDMQITIDGLSQLVLSARSAAQLQRQDLLQLRNEQLLQLIHQLWPPQQTYINEYY